MMFVLICWYHIERNSVISLLLFDWMHEWIRFLIRYGTINEYTSKYNMCMKWIIEPMRAWSIYVLRLFWRVFVFFVWLMFIQEAAANSQAMQMMDWQYWPNRIHVWICLYVCEMHFDEGDELEIQCLSLSLFLCIFRFCTFFLRFKIHRNGNEIKGSLCISWREMCLTVGNVGLYGISNNNNTF